MGDRLGIPGAVSFCFSFTGQLTHFSKLQHSCVLLYPFNLIAASFCLLTSLWLLSAFGVTKDSSASSFFISLQGAIDRLFLATTWEMYPLRFQVQISRIQRQNKFSSSSFFWCWWLVKNYLQVNKSNIQLFLVLFWYLETGQEIHQLKKFNEITIKVRANIYLFFIILFRHGLSVFFIIQN